EGCTYLPLPGIVHCAPDLSQSLLPDNTAACAHPRALNESSTLYEWFPFLRMLPKEGARRATGRDIRRRINHYYAVCYRTLATKEPEVSNAATIRPHPAIA